MEEKKDEPQMDWQIKQREFEAKKARAKALQLRLTCTICGAKPRTLLICPCASTQYCSTECQRIDWRDRGHRKACKKIRNERAAEAARAEAPPSPPEEVFYGPAPRSHADEVRARIAAEHEAARARREANPEPAPLSARYGPRCPVCLEEWDVNDGLVINACCCRRICSSCQAKSLNAPCPICRAPFPKSAAEDTARLRRHVENEVPEAIHALGCRYVDGSGGFVKSAKKAAKIFKRAVELGSVDAMLSLGRLYFNGADGVKRDVKKAEKLYRLAADRGDAIAQCNYGSLVKDRDPEAAVYYWKLSAAKGYAFAEFLVGLLHYHGDGGMERDPAEARRLLELAAAKGHEGAKRNLAALNAET
jgi:TPR repeat protein